MLTMRFKQGVSLVLNRIVIVKALACVLQTFLRLALFNLMSNSNSTVEKNSSGYQAVKLWLKKVNNTYLGSSSHDLLTHTRIFLRYYKDFSTRGEWQ